MRSSFTGKIILVPTSAHGSFENTDLFNRKIEPLSKNEAFLVEEDYLTRCNIDIKTGSIKHINIDEKWISFSKTERIPYDKLLIAWGSQKKRLNKEYTNVYYLEDRFAHARAHNEIIKAKTVVIMGSTVEAYKTACSVREYLDSINHSKTKVIIFDD